MSKFYSVASIVFALAGCATAGGTESTTPEQGECPATSTGPLTPMDERTIPCAVAHDGCCFAESTAACAFAGCPNDCDILRTDPGQVECR